MNVITSAITVNELPFSSLSLEGNHIGGEGAQALGTALKNTEKLQYLYNENLLF